MKRLSARSRRRECTGPAVQVCAVYGPGLLAPSAITPLIASPIDPDQNRHGPTSTSIVDGSERVLERVTLTLICMPQLIGFTATTLPVKTVWSLGGRSISATGQRP